MIALAWQSGLGFAGVILVAGYLAIKVADWLDRFEDDLMARSAERAQEIERDLAQPPASIRELTATPYDWTVELRAEIRALPETHEVAR